MTKEQEEKGFVRASKIAAKYHVTQETVRRWTEAGMPFEKLAKPPRVITIPKQHKVFDPHAVEQWLAANPQIRKIGRPREKASA